MSNQCTQCASWLEDGAAVCAHCGAPAAEPVPPVVAEEDAAAPLATPAVAAPDVPVQPPVAPPVFSSGDDLHGIGGWLLLSACGLAISPFMIAHSVYTDLHILYGVQFQPGLSIHPGLAGLVLFEAVTNSMFLAAVLALNYLLYNRKRIFPASMVAFLAAQIVWVLVDHLMALHYNPHSNWTPLFRSIGAGLIWIPYFLQSQRVELTFVND
jgi:hypothetical protein